MALKIQVTTAGRTALVNAANTGTLPVQVSQIGVTATAFVAAAGDLALPGELKRLVTFGGAAVADDTIHTTIRDTSADTYSLRGFGLYLADGTLFALYGQADAILEKSAGAMMMLATDIIFADIDAASLTFGDTNFLNPPATVDVQGVVELATDAETIAGVDAVRAVTPKGLLAKLTALLGAGAPSAFVKTLLTAVDLVAFRTLLSIKTAASYDIGVGNGLDADLLDGQHGAYYRSYANLTGVPAMFTPSAHAHSAADITSGTLPVARGGTGAGTLTAGSYLVGNGTAAVGVKTPAQVLADIGAAPVAHSHAIGDVNGLQAALDARPLQTAVTAQITAAVNALVDGAPGAIDTLNELAAALGDDPNFSATVINALASKAPLASPRLSSAVPVGADVADTAAARANAPGVQGAGGVGSGGTILFGNGATNWGYIKGYFTNGVGNGVGRIVIGTRTGTTDDAMTAKITIFESGATVFASTVAAANLSGTNTGDQDLSGLAPKASPALTGTPTAPTAATATNTTQLATTAFVQAVVNAVINGAPGALDTLRELATAMGDDPNFAATVTNALALKAPLASPVLTGTPTAPTAAAGTNTTQLATTAFVKAAIDAALANYLPKNNPTFTGTMTGPAYNKAP